MSYSSVEKRRAYQREYDKRPKVQERRCRTRREWWARMEERNGKLVFDYLKEHPCIDCGETDPLVLQFDHRIPLNDANAVRVSKLVHRGSLDKLKSEITKCDVRCANCHIRRHILEGKYKWTTRYGF